MTARQVISHPALALCLANIGGELRRSVVSALKHNQPFCWPTVRINRLPARNVVGWSLKPTLLRELALYALMTAE